MTLSRRSIALIVAVILVALVVLVVLPIALWSSGAESPSPQGIELREAQAFR